MSGAADTFDKVFMAYYRGEPSNHYTERDDGYIHNSESASIYFRTYEEWESYERQRCMKLKAGF